MNALLQWAMAVALQYIALEPLLALMLALTHCVSSLLLGAPELAEDFGLDLNEEPGSRPGTAPKEGKE